MARRKPVKHLLYGRAELEEFLVAGRLSEVAGSKFLREFMVSRGVRRGDDQNGRVPAFRARAHVADYFESIALRKVQIDEN